MAQYEMQFKNSTDSACHFGVYQNHPTSPGLQSLVWQEKELAPNSAVIFTWNMQYGVAVTDYNGSEYIVTQQMDASLGSSYQVKSFDGIPAIDSTPLETGLPADLIKLCNNTFLPLDLGFTVGGNLTAATRSNGSQCVSFTPHPIYYVALYKSVQLGHLVDSNLQVISGPVRIEFNSGNQRALVECYTENGRVNLRSSLI